ncbi:MAG: PEP-CTERM system TPR-repeat protein PrsT [Colwellia sp.]|nr:PEP-CTERM system TPR-repeat protein PrsT [Colwellia sp.]
MKFTNIIIFFASVLFLSACGDNESAQTYISKAEKLIVEKQNSAAVIALKNAIKIDVKNAKARFLLGRLYLSSGEAESAIKELQRALSLQYEKAKVIPLLARAYMLTKSDEDILALSEQAESLPGEVKSHYLAYKTMAAIRTGNDELAQASVEQAKIISTSNVYALLAESYLTFSQKKLPQANTLVGRILSIEPQHPDALMLQGQIAMVMEDFKLAIISFEKYIIAQPKFGIAQLLIANALYKSGDHKQAEQYADNILAKVNNQPFAHYIKAMVRFSAKDYQKANEHAEVALQANFNQLDLKLVAGASAFHLKSYEKCHHHLSTLVDYLPKNHVARRMLAISQLELGLVNEISNTLNGFESADKEGAQFLSALSFKLLELGAVNEVKQIVEQSLPTVSDNAEQSARKGILKLMMNDPSGIDNLRNAIKLNPEFVEAELVLAFSAIKTSDFEQATKISNKWIDKYPTLPGGFNLLASINLKKNKLNAAREALNKSLSLDENNLFALTEMVRVATLQNQAQEALALSDKAINLYPTSLKALRQYFQLNKNESGLTKLEQAYLKDKNSVNHLILFGAGLISLEKIEQAITLLSAYLPSQKTPKKYWQLLYVANKKINENKKAQQVLEKWRKVNSHHLEPLVLLANTFAQQRDFSRAIGIINSGLEENNTNVVLKMVKLQLLLSSQDSVAAKNLYQTFDKEKLNDSIKAGIQGRIYLLEKSYKQAITLLEQYYKVYPQDQNVLYLTAALQGSNELGQAKLLLENHIKNNASANEKVKSLLASFYLNGEQDKALVVYESIIKTQENNIIINNNLAWLYLQKGNHELALIHAEKAVSLAPEVPNVVDTYSQVLLQSGNKRLALGQSEKAHTLSKGKDVDITLNYVEVLIANSRKNEAKRLLIEVIIKTDIQQNKKDNLFKQL